MTEPLEQLEHRINDLRAALRGAATSGDRQRARELRASLRQAEHAWEDALADVEEQAAAGDVEPAPAPALTHAARSGPLVPLREQVHQVLTLLTVPAAPKLITEVHAAFFGGEIIGARLTSVRRDEERSFAAAPLARPYYICAALTAELLAPARALLAVSTWPMEQRVVGPLSPRVDFLTAATRVAEHVQRLRDPGPAAVRLLWRFATNIPGAPALANQASHTHQASRSGAAWRLGAAKPAAVVRAAQAELDVHRDEDASHRAAAAARARDQLNDIQRLFGAQLRAMPGTGTGA